MKKSLSESNGDTLKLKEKNQQLLLLIGDLEKRIKNLTEQLTAALKSLQESERRNQDLAIELQTKTIEKPQSLPQRRVVPTRRCLPPLCVCFHCRLNVRLI